MSDEAARLARQLGLVVEEDGDLVEQRRAVYEAEEPDARYRYLLTRRWDLTRDSLVLVMLNPSTATASVEDPTLRRCIRFARRERLGGVTLVNLFALRASRPERLAADPAPVGPHADAFLRLAVRHCGPVVVAWGAHPFAAQRAERVLAELARAQVEPLCLGLTAGGQPRHPLYVRGDAPLRPFTTERAHHEERMLSSV